MTEKGNRGEESVRREWSVEKGLEYVVVVVVVDTYIMILTVIFRMIRQE